MELNPNFEDTSQKLFRRSHQRSKTPDRITYESEVEVIRSQIGDLEDIRHRLGISARKMAHLLMVDPSAWSRWSKKVTPPPPHVYRALQWYLILQEKNPGFTPQIFLAHRWHGTRSANAENSVELSLQIEKLKQKIDNLESREARKREKSFEGSEGDGLRSFFSSRIHFKLLGSILLGMILGAILARVFSGLFL